MAPKRSVDPLPDDSSEVMIIESCSSKPPLKKRRRRAAATSSIKPDCSLRGEDPDDMVVIKDCDVVESEDIAIVSTICNGEAQFDKPRRRLVEVFVFDQDNNPQAIEMLDHMPLHVSGIVLPGSGPLDKKNGVRCTFGPLDSWHISGFEKGDPVIWLSTDAADYVCVKGASNYKKCFGALQDKVAVTVAVFKALSKPDGGDPLLSVDDVVGRVSRLLAGVKMNQVFGGEFLRSIGCFIADQLAALDANAGDGDQIFTGLPALEALRKGAAALPGSKGSGGIRISEGGTSNAAGVGEDEKLALQLQEQENKRGSNRSRGRTAPAGAAPYVKINEEELAEDYPLPDYFKPEEDEVDEYGLFDDLDQEDLPKRVLHDWCLYNYELRFVPLELLPMVDGADSDVEIFGSGLMTDDDGSGYNEDYEIPEHGIRVYLSAIKEWVVEFGSLISISIRTDGAWYRLGKPAAAYAPFYAPVLKAATVAPKVIAMLKNAGRASRLSFQDVVKRLARQPEDSPAFISPKEQQVERYIVVHGQIILHQFAGFPDPAIQKSAFVTGLISKMERRNHTKLEVSKKKKVPRGGRNSNPRANVQADKKQKPMRATTTKLINHIWSQYYATEERVADADAKDLQSEDVDDDENNEAENITPNVIQPEKPFTAVKKTQANDVKWIGTSTGSAGSGDVLFGGASVRGEVVKAGTVIFFSEVDAFLLVEYLYAKRERPMAHGRVLVRGAKTVLLNAANKTELFLTKRCEDFALKDAGEIVKFEIRQRLWGFHHRRQNAASDEADRQRTLDRERESLSPEYFCQALYVPEDGAFYSLRHGTLGAGTGTCEACEHRKEVQANAGIHLLPDNKGFKLDDVEYNINDFLYLDPDSIQSHQAGPLESEKFKASRNKGLSALVVCQLLSVMSPVSKKNNAAVHISIRRFYRPDEVDNSKAYKAEINEVYYSEDTRSVTTSAIKGKCTVVKQTSETEVSVWDHLFVCTRIYDPVKGTTKQLPASIKLGRPRRSNAKAKGKEIDGFAPSADNNKLATLDVFAGCGGLSEGLHQAGVSDTKWAIEYDHAAAEAFKLNHQNAEVFVSNCNVILRYIMERQGDIDDCISTPEAEQMSSQLSVEQKNKLPSPGEVEFITGGPPCQGFSGMNRFNKSPWSKVQCEMILAFLSYADYYRPRYFLLENVRNFVSFDKGQPFRLTMACLLEIGFQVRFGILQAGNYGVSQSRTRAFIWAAAPGEVLPEWPQPIHVFASSQLKVPLTDDSYYTAVKGDGRMAPLRSITVRDAIGDLPLVDNGADKSEIQYDKPPESWFQKQIRGNEVVLREHICKEMNELNFKRCQLVPKRPGADWRDLPETKVKLSTGQEVDLVPWCLPNTAKRHNQWKGLFGRLDWEGNFPTSVTDPQPMGKVGMCFHPEQDRIVTVRECARSQGFPDCYRFYGNIQSKHRQIGNAVPPHLAKALGQKLKQALEAGE